MGHIVAAGHLCVDIAPQLISASAIEPGGLAEVGPLTMQLGGSVANTGGDLADLGLPVRLSAAIAGDQLGGFVREDFARRRLEPCWLQEVESAGTSYSLVMEPKGQDRSIWHYAGANAHFDPTKVDLSGAAIVHLGYPPLLGSMLQEQGEPLRRFFQRARLLGATTSLDMSVVPRSQAAEHDWQAIFANILPEVDIFTPSVDDIASAVGVDGFAPDELVCSWAGGFIAAGVAVVMLSGGARGLFAQTASKSRFSDGGVALNRLPTDWHGRAHRREPFKLNRVKTTNGAGDAATAGLLFGVWQELSLEGAVESAAACAAVKIAGGALSAQSLESVRAGAGLLERRSSASASLGARR